MTGIMGVNRVGLKRRPTFEEIINTENFKPKYPDRSYKFLRNSPQMTQFDNMSMFEFDDYYQRERVQRQMHDLMSSIAESSNLTVDKLKAVTQAIGKLRPKLDVGDVVDMEGAGSDLAGQLEFEKRLKAENLAGSIALAQADIAGSSAQDPVLNLIGQTQGQASGSSEDPNKPPDPDVLESGLTSGIISEYRRILAEAVDKKYKSSSTVQRLNARIVRAIAENRGIRTVKREAGPNTLEQFHTVKHLADLIVQADAPFFED